MQPLGRSETTTWVEVDLSAIKHNIREIKRHTQGLPLMPIVKANAYGHGAVAVARACEEMNVEFLGVVSVEEALALRDAMNSLPILVLSYSGIFLPRKLLQEAIKKNISFALFDIEMAHLLSLLGKRLRKTVTVHVKIDTGTTRIGMFPKDSVRFVESVRKLPRLKIQGLFTHFANAEDDNTKLTISQTRQFSRTTSEVQKKIGRVPYIHAACSAALLNIPKSYFTLGRLGIGLYGLWPSEEMKKKYAKKIALKPALQWKSKVIQVKKIPKGTKIGYGGTFVARRDMMIAVCAFGYADGYDRLLSNRGRVIINKQLAAVCGRVCMNLTMVDVTHIPRVKTGSKVTILGHEKGIAITAEDIAQQSNTIHYETITRINWNIKRFYRK